MRTHPRTPNIVLTASADHTLRVWNLDLLPPDMTSNPHWPGGMGENRTGPAHGLQASELVGIGPGAGRCVAVLAGGGGRAGGHRAAVLDFAFHPSLQLVATCGVRASLTLISCRVIDSMNADRQIRQSLASARIR
jgi:WD40 repeat protein